MSLIRRFIPTKNEREIKRLAPVIEEIGALEAQMKALPDEAFPEKTADFRRRLEAGETLDDLLPEAFALCREAAVRSVGMRHYDVQLIGGAVLHAGRIAEMKTGEGKTLVATAPVYLNALAGKGVHVVTVNDYLATRDAEWMGQVYRFLGLSVGVIRHGLNDAERKEAYGADVTYGTNNEFGFDYLRDNMKFRAEQFVGRELNFAIVDEVDSILIDEARTPLIISGPSEDSTDKYYSINKVIPKLSGEDHYSIDEKAKSVVLTEEGIPVIEALLGVKNLYEPENIEILHHVNQALRAHTLFKRDVDYVVKDGKVIIVDEFTGRLMEGRRYGDGLHQALEAKEGLTVASENQTLASITFQNYFRMYDKLSGMTGTADTEAAEFHKIYELDVTVIPTHRPMVRIDHDDVVYRTKQEKVQAVIEEIRDCHERGQPVLVGTISIEDSEFFSRALRKSGVPHHVLNAKAHEREAEIVAQAGRLGAVTISTNMAGRGTDIVLGGNPDALVKHIEDPEERDRKRLEYEEICVAEREEVVKAGGLHILGTERHESRRIDNQLRGRSGRQGDPGSTRFFISLQDDLMRIFASDWVSNMMQRLGMEEGEPIEARLVTRAIENAQKKVEARNFEIRKHLLDYDDVMNRQREIIYAQRRSYITGQDIKKTVREMTDDLVELALSYAIPEKTHPEEWDVEAIEEAVRNLFGVRIEVDLEKLDALTEESLFGHVCDAVAAAYDLKENEIGAELLRLVEQDVLLRTIDTLWKDHLLTMDHLKEGINMRAYAQKDPKREYQREGFELFEALQRRIKEEAIGLLFRVQIERREDAIKRREEELRQRALARQRMMARAVEHGGGEAAQAAQPAQAAAAAQGGGQASRPAAARTAAGGGKPATVRREGDKVGRNDPCPCGSGKKYKKCCGR